MRPGISIIKYSFVFLFLLFINASLAQSPDTIFKTNIHTARLYAYGDQLGLPVIHLNTGDQLELHFDDVDANLKYYYYTYQLCDKDWNPVNLSQFDYLKGFTQMRINNYRFSSIAFARYTHYQAILPERDCYPSRSGNYLLKVFLDGDLKKVAFTKRLLVVDNKAVIKGQVLQPFAPQYFRTHQKVQFTVNIQGVNTFSANQEIKVVVLQNYRWDNAITNVLPTFIRGSTLDYSMEDKIVFPAGKEWRWLDLRDFHLQSDRVDSAAYKKTTTEIYLKPDADRTGQRYVYYRDMNGMYTIETLHNINPFWQSEYGTVNFTYVPPNGEAYATKDVYLFGQLTNYNYADSLRMQFNPVKGAYETKLLLKEGYYNYTYVAADKNNFGIRNELEGNYYETENQYTILVYYKSFTSRSDELIGVTTINSRSDRPGLTF